MGGSFDPVHKAHKALALVAFEQCSLDKIIFIPARQANLRDEPVCANSAQRLKMLELSLADFQPPHEIELFEISNPQISYSINTADFLIQKYPNCSINWIIGADHLDKLKNWKSIDELSKKISFICAAREGFESSFDKTKLPKNASVNFIDFSPLPHSSTRIRALLKTAPDSPQLHSLLDCEVFSFIKNNHLYGT